MTLALVDAARPAWRSPVVSGSRAFRIAAAALIGASTAWPAFPLRAAPAPAAAAPAVSASAAAVVVPITPHDFFLDQVDSIESDLALLLQRRAEASGSALAVLDYQIDLRLILRWMMVKAADSEADGPLQASVWLRVATLKSAGKQVAQRLETATRAMTAAQLDGLKKLHQLTYDLPEGKDIASVDTVCKTVATELILAASLTPAEVKSLPPMRPQPLPDAPATQPSSAPRSLADLAKRAQAVALSPALHRQLSSLAAAANAAAADSKKQDEASALFDMLGSTIDLADGLETNTGIDAVSRPKVEQQLIESLALFTDTRTRAAGQNRIAALSQYRNTLLRIQRLNLSAALHQKLGPVFVWINNNPETGAKVLVLIEKYLQLCARYDARKDPPSLQPNQKRTLDVLQKQFTSHRTAFLDDANELAIASPAGAGGLGGSVFSAGGLPNLNVHVDQMRQMQDYIDVVQNLPHAMTVLASYKPRPTGALEKRVTAAVADLGATGLATTHDASAKLLADLERLAKVAESLSPPLGVPSEIIKAYTHGRMDAVDARRITVVGGLVSQSAGGKDMDASDLSKLETLRTVFESMRMAADVEAGLGKADLLSRWADWSISPAQLRALVSPYRDATAAAFDGFADDNTTPIGRWGEVRKRFLPILELVKEIGLYAEQCSDLPTGLPGDFAKLLTPMDGQPFATERYASMAVGTWQRASEGVDQKPADDIFSAMLERLRKDLKINQ